MYPVVHDVSGDSLCTAHCGVAPLGPHASRVLSYTYPVIHDVPDNMKRPPWDRTRLACLGILTETPLLLHARFAFARCSTANPRAFRTVWP